MAIEARKAWSVGHRARGKTACSLQQATCSKRAEDSLKRKEVGGRKTDGSKSIRKLENWRIRELV